MSDKRIVTVSFSAEKWMLDALDEIAWQHRMNRSEFIRSLLEKPLLELTKKKV